MKAKLEYYLHWLREGAMRVVRAYPVETALALAACVGWLFSYEQDWDLEKALKLMILPVFFLLALAVNHLAGRGPWRKLYWVCWVPLVPLFVWNGLGEWVQTTGFVLSFWVLAPLGLLMSRRAVKNESFVCDAIVWLRSVVLALLFANVALGLFCAILYSTTYIFNLTGNWIGHVAMYAVILTESLAVPVLLLMMADRWLGRECRGNRIVEVLLNYIVTPALLIYTAILYLYAAKILFTWSLPEGGVAYLVFGFTLTALVVKALQQLLEKRLYDWFFDRFSLVSLPLIALFWIGVVRRTSEYGLTEPRVYLVVCGALMSVCIVLFLTRCTGRYLWVCLAGFFAFAALAYVPPLAPKRIAVRSQAHRAERIARQLDLLDQAGAIRLDAVEKTDTASRRELKGLYESLRYVEWRDSAAFARFGISDADDVLERVPASIRRHVQYGWDHYDTSDDDSTEYIRLDGAACRGPVSIGEYKVLYADVRSWYGDSEVNYRFADDTLRISFGEFRPEFVVAGQKLLDGQIEKIWGAGVLPQTYQLEDEAERMLTYADGEVKVLFSDMSLERRDSVLRLSDVTISAVLTR